jgi:hypothetical protein
MTASLQGWRRPLWYLAAAALLAGIYARFKGLGSAPLAVDEYYLAQSIENVLRTGVPAFNCGGLYMRGLVLQYSSALLQLNGSSAEFAPRFLSAIASLISIPAVYLLGRRTHGRIIALLAISIIALSVWEVEMARFARMYAPFQAVFLWYLVFFMRYTVDRDARALWPMIALSVVGPLVWEGGVFLDLLNLLSLFLRRWPNSMRRADWVYLLSCTALLTIALWFAAADFRGYNANSWPPGYVLSVSKAAPDPITTLRLPLGALRQHPWWGVAVIVPAVGIIVALRWIWTLRARRFLAAGLIAMLIAAVAHQFLAVGATALLLLLTGLISWKEFFDVSARPMHVAVILCALFWLSFGIVLADWHGSIATSFARRVSLLGYQLLRFPDFVSVVARPWAAAVPRLGIGLLLLVGAAFIRAAKNNKTSNYERVVCVTFLVLLLAASASHPPRQETRYVFFLYPVALILALTTLARVADSLIRRPAIAVAATSAFALGGFALSEDFDPHHLLYIDTPAETFRVGLAPRQQSHLVVREDYRFIAHWLQQHRSDAALLINGVHGLDHYYPGFNYFYVDVHDPNFPDWTCGRGTVERWGNYPLLYSVNALVATVTAKRSAYLVAFAYNREQILASLALLHPRVALSDGNIIVINLRG